MYIVRLQDAYSEALLAQAKRKVTILRRWWNWGQAPFGRCLPGCWINHRTGTGLHCRRVGKWDQITVDSTAVYDSLHYMCLCSNIL